MTFAERTCGDCLITALVSASGDRGLNAILPSEDAIYYPPLGGGEGVWDTSEPVLPMTKTWQEADFGLRDVIRRGSDVWDKDEVPGQGVNLRKWSLKLLTRYHYAMGKLYNLVNRGQWLTYRLDQLCPRDGAFTWPANEKASRI